MSNPFTRFTKMQLAVMAFAALAAVALPLRGRIAAGHPPALAATPPLPPKMPSGGMAMPQTLVCPLWRVGPDLVAKIHIKNALMVAPLVVTPTLYMADGTPYPLPPVEVPRSGEAAVNLNQALQDAPPSLGGHVSDYGSAALTYVWDGAGHVSATMNLKDLVHSLAFHQAFLDLPAGMRTAAGSVAALTGYERWKQQREHAVLASYHIPAPGAGRAREAGEMQTPPLQGLWWKRDPGVAGYFALGNTSPSPIEVRYRVSGSAGAEAPGPTVSLDPNATSVIALEPLLALLPSPQRNGGGITVEQLSGPAMAMSASGWLENEGEGFSASIEFQPGSVPQTVPQTADADTSGINASAPPPAAAGPTVLAASGLMLGKPMGGAGFPGQVRFRPYGYLRNTTARPLLATISASVAMGAMGMAGTASPPPVVQTFQALLPPHALVEVALAPLAENLERELGRKMKMDPDAVEGAMLNWSVSFDGTDGEVLMTTGSTDQTGNYVFEVLPVRMGNAVGLQLPYWNTAHGNDTMYSLWNPGAAAQRVVLTLYSADGMHSYAIPVTLAPGAAAMVDLGRLRQEGVPDPGGNLLPPEVEDGSAMLEPAAAAQPGPNGKIMQPASGPAQMQVAVNAGIFNAQAATCCSECNLCCFYNCPGVAAALAALGGTMQSDFTVEDCCGFLDDFTSYAGWASGDTSICSSQGSGLFDALGVGETSLRAQANDLETEEASDYPVCARGCLSGILASNNNGTVTQCGDPQGNPVTDAGNATEYGASTDRGSLITEYGSGGPYAPGVRDDAACSTTDSTCIADAPVYSPQCGDFTNDTSLGGPYYGFSTMKGSDVYGWALIQYPLVAPATAGYGVNAWVAAIVQLGGSEPTFNSGYRTPVYNATLPGSAAASRHMFGDAADLNNAGQSQATFNLISTAAANANATYTEPQLKSTLSHVHADWRGYDATRTFQH